MSYTYPWTRRTPQVRLPEHQLGQAIHRPPGSLSAPRIPVRNPFGVSGGGSFGTFLANIGRGGSEHRGALVSDQPALLLAGRMRVCLVTRAFRCRNTFLPKLVRRPGGANGSFPQTS